MRVFSPRQISIYHTATDLSIPHLTLRIHMVAVPLMLIGRGFLFGNLYAQGVTLRA